MRGRKKFVKRLVGRRKRLPHKRETEGRNAKVVTLCSTDPAQVAGVHPDLGLLVSRRSREIGIRMAIGADRQKVIRMVLQQGLVLGSIGVAAGLILSFFACRALTSAIWIASFSHLDYGVFPVIAAPLLLVTLLATYGPARRASLIDPMRALREE
jgi:putative ABC transport system permease protein